MANILLIETATDICSIGLVMAGQLVALEETTVYNEHGKRITLLIEACLKQAGVAASELDAVAVSSGPGSFTSLRIGVATAKGLCYALGKPLISVDTLKALAMSAVWDEDQNYYYASMIDARSMGVFFSIYNEKGKEVKSLAREKLEKYDLSEYFSNNRKLVFCGAAAKKYKERELSENIIFRTEVENSAKNLLSLAVKAYEMGLWEDLAYYEPNYLAAPNITVSKKKQPKKIL